MAEHFRPGAHPYNNAAEVKRLATCNRCGDDKLAWRKSAKTGKWYLCDVQKIDRWYTREQPIFKWFELARNAHKCPPRAAQRVPSGRSPELTLGGEL